MLDLISVASTVALFALAWMYVHGCDHLRNSHKAGRR